MKRETLPEPRLQEKALLTALDCWRLAIEFKVKGSTESVNSMAVQFAEKTGNYEALEEVCGCFNWTIVSKTFGITLEELRG